VIGRRLFDRAMLRPTGSVSNSSVSSICISVGSSSGGNSNSLVVVVLVVVVVATCDRICCTHFILN
jgi:hypothetical protein